MIFSLFTFNFPNLRRARVNYERRSPRARDELVFPANPINGTRYENKKKVWTFKDGAWYLENV